MMFLWLTCGLVVLASVVWLAPTVVRTTQWWVALSVMLLVPILSFVGYWAWGGSQQVEATLQYQQKVREVAKLVQQMGSRQQVIALLNKQLQERPNDAKGWYLLGKLYLGGGDYHQAKRCLARANQLAPGQESTVAALKEAQEKLAKVRST